MSRETEHSCDHCGKKIRRGQQVLGTTVYTQGMEFCNKECEHKEFLYQTNNDVDASIDD